MATFRAVVERAAPGLPRNEDLVRAWAPALEKIRRNKQWAAYIRLTVMIQNLDRLDKPSVLTSFIYDDMIKYMIDLFVAANPATPRRRVLMALYFLHGAFIHILSDVHAFERLLSESDDPIRRAPDLLDELAHSFAHGLEG
jgi:hypothetical protein